MKRHPTSTRMLLAVLFAACSPAYAQQSDDSWHFLIEPYVLLPNMNGETAIGTLPPAHIDEDPQDIFDKLQAGAMLFGEAHNDRWAVSLDVLYMKLEADIDARTVIRSGSAEVQQLGSEIAVLRRLSDVFELGIAGQYNRIEAELELTLNPLGTALRGDLAKDWIDPVIVGRLIVPFSDRWFLHVRGNIGGFGVGSELTWQVQADVGLHISDLLRITFGYRVIDIDYDSGSGRDRFVYDMMTFGPTVRFGFTF